MEDVYDRFKREGTWHDIMGTTPTTGGGVVVTPTVPQGATVSYPAVAQGSALPTTTHVLNVGRNDYNMQGTLEAARDYGIPSVMTQTSPYARIAYTYGPSGPIPLIGATSVYPHVVSSGRYDYAAPFRRNVVPVGASLADIMAHVERMSRPMRGGGGGGGGGGVARGGGRVAAQPADAPVQRIDNRGLKLSPDDDTAERQGLLVSRPDQPVAPTATPPTPVDGGPNYDLYPGIGMQDDVDDVGFVNTFNGPSEAEFIRRAQEGPGLVDYLGQQWDRFKGALRNMPRNVKPGRAPESVYPVAPEPIQPMMAPQPVPIAPKIQPYLVPQPTLSSAMALPLRHTSPTILRG